MLSFYGGRSGQNFSIKKVFNNYSEMIDDLKDINSSIETGEYVIIFYGKPGTEEYKVNLKKDTDAGYENKNASFWQKQYGKPSLSLRKKEYIEGTGDLNGSISTFKYKYLEGEYLENNKVVLRQAGGQADDFSLFFKDSAAIRYNFKINDKANELGIGVYASPFETYSYPSNSIAPLKENDFIIVTPYKLELNAEQYGSFGDDDSSTTTQGDGDITLEILDISQFYYKNFGYFSANIPEINVGTVTKIAPVKVPNVTKSEQSTSDNCMFDFDLPKAPRFYLGDLIDIKQLYSLSYGNSCEITNQELYDLCEDGDFYIVKSHQLIYQIINHGPAEGRVVLKYCGQFSMNLDKIDASYIDTYKQNDDGSYSLSDIKINKMSQVSVNTGGAIEKTDVEISIPHIPNFSVDSVQTTEAGTSASAIIKHKDTNTLAFDFTIPKGDTGATGPVGPVGPGFDIINMIEVTGTNENINETIVAKLNQLYTTKPESTQIIGVNYIDSSTGNVIASYWYCWTQNAWHSINAFGGSNLSWKEF